MTLTLTLDRVEVTLVEVYPHTKLDGNRKNVLWTYGRTDTPGFQSTRSSPGDDLKMEMYCNANKAKSKRQNYVIIKQIFMVCVNL